MMCVDVTARFSGDAVARRPSSASSTRQRSVPGPRRLLELSFLPTPYTLYALNPELTRRPSILKPLQPKRMLQTRRLRGLS